MDLSMIEQLIPNLAGWLHLEPSTVLLMLILISFVGNIVGRLIPDSVTGWVGVVRDISKIIGGYVQNRVTPGVKVSDVVGGLVKTRIQNEIDHNLQTVELDDVIPEAEEIVREVIPAFPGLLNRNPED